MSVLVQKRGLLDTLQDRGRYGYQSLGINPGGVMDLVAMRVANALVGNQKNETVLEMHYPAPALLFEEAALVSLAGADFTAGINGQAFPLHKPVVVQKGSLLQFAKRERGARVYLAIAGGFAADEWLGSYSTNLKAGAGGYDGRVLQKGDRLLQRKENFYPLEEAGQSMKPLPWQANIDQWYRKQSLRFVQGKNWELLSGESLKQLGNTLFHIGQDSDRMGYRLQGPAMQLQEIKEMISAAVTRGAVQVLPDGQLIVLMADHQTTGGYPVPMHIITADMPALAQLQPGETFRFEPVTPEEAIASYHRQEMDLQQLQNACNFRLQQYFNT